MNIVYWVKVRKPVGFRVKWLGGKYDFKDQ